MITENLYEDEQDYARHTGAIEQLEQEAQAMGFDKDTIRPIYESELYKLKSTAIILDYLPVLVTRQIRQGFFNNKHG